MRIKDQTETDCLIYEYGEKGSIDKYLKDDELASKLNWKHRVQIAAGKFVGIRVGLSVYIDIAHKYICIYKLHID
jgi:hypothetical protein